MIVCHIIAQIFTPHVFAGSWYDMIWYDIDKKYKYIFIITIDDLDSQIKYPQSENCLFISR
jgi:hypothetical protein